VAIGARMKAETREGKKKDGKARRSFEGDGAQEKIGIAEIRKMGS